VTAHPAATGATWRCATASADETRALGRALAACLLGGEVLALDGELGAGKTCFVQGLAEGLGIPPDEVSSPTFVIRHEHRGRLPLAHLDFYRLDDPDEIEWLDLLDAPEDAVLVIEWAEKLPAVLPSDRLAVHLTPGSGPDERVFEWSAMGPVAERALLALMRRP
jgi:tRNA threonylcarbamoyladenosine biosynthesis protein TsaE